MKADNTALQSNPVKFPDKGHAFEDAVQALENQLKDGVDSALHERTYTVDELRQELGL